MSKNLSALSAKKGLKDGLFERFAELSGANGTVGQEELKGLAQEYLIGSANTYGTVSFYDFLNPGNKKIYICNGSACMMSGKQVFLQKEISDHFREDEIGEVSCLGRCYENGAYQYENKNYSGGTFQDKAENNADGGYTVSGKGAVILTSGFSDITSYYESLVKWLKEDPVRLLKEIKKSGLRGRGGAGFPVGLKLETCHNQKSEEKYLVCNADEGDPGAYTDRYILERQPHALIYGMIVGAFVAGAGMGIIYIRAEYPEACAVVEKVLSDLRNEGVLGVNILGSSFSFDIKLIRAAGSYVCGEETALLNSIEGQRPEVRVRPPYPAIEGLFGKPTLVNNVETLASLKYIVENGGSAFANTGTKTSTGTKLICLDSFFNHPGVFEVEMGTPLAVVVYELGGGFRTKVKALHIGGPLGGIVPVHKIDSLHVDFESFKDQGFLLGHGSIVSIPDSFPMIKYLSHLFEFTAKESCGKCFPCRLGSQRGYELLEKAQHEGLDIDHILFDDLLDTLEKGSLCALGGGLPLPVKNALNYFGEELSPYFKESGI
ncbi:MAG: NADH-quinone oxidoreductase subunit L [Cyclobacteriaceae bacterium]|nr:NADH-quinone oxidoreductase subunit L [Cyclobacteriaceae bacterium]